MCSHLWFRVVYQIEIGFGELVCTQLQRNRSFFLGEEPVAVARYPLYRGRVETVTLHQVLIQG
ncbi:MAG: hypothetical protein EBV05_04255 [Cyanobacteria bacterium WB6_1B_304]|nr:hypothetical protein [Cyanobacteria bacterium WB6_1B_304]